MKIKSLKAAYFSPTGTTRKIVQAIAEGINSAETDFLDITGQPAREIRLQTNAEELLLIAVPVYMGRVPDLLSNWLKNIEAEKTPVVCVVVYGNRVYDNALLELADILTDRGCLAVAAAAYVGEHSFASPEKPVALGRPDKNDLDHAHEFGRSIGEKLIKAEDIAGLPEFHIPGNRPYEGITELWDVDFIAVGGSCINCGTCYEACPVGAISEDSPATIDISKCITCCACIKQCPQQARSIKPGPVEEASIRLHTLFSEPKKPECYL